MRAVLAVLALSALALAFYVVSGVDSVQVYFICGAASSYDFGMCNGNCTGFVAALEGDLRQAKVLVGGRPAELLYVREYVLNDVYRPKLLVAVFRATWPGKVAVQGLSDFEAYVLINHGVGDKRYVYRLFVVPFTAGRNYTAPFQLRLGLTGEFWACTTGKYASKVETDGRISDFKTGYYMSFASGYGSLLTFHWASVPESAVKLLYAFVRAPVVYRAYVVGLDGRPVPAQYLAYIVKRGNVAGDGVVVFEDFGVVSVGGADVVLRPNETYTVPGRPCTVTGYTSLGSPLEIELVYGGQVAARGSGSVRGYCIEGSYRVRYRFSKSGAVRYQLEGETPGNVTVETARVAFVVLGLFQQPWAVVEEEVPLGKRVELKVGDFSAAVVPQPPVTTVQRYPLYTQLGVAAGGFALAWAVASIIASVFNRDKFARAAATVSGILSGTLILVYILGRLLSLSPLSLPSFELDTLTAVVGLVVPLAFIFAYTSWRPWKSAIPSAVLASFYAAAVWTSLGALEPWHVLVFMAVGAIIGRFYNSSIMDIRHTYLRPLAAAFLFSLLIVPYLGDLAAVYFLVLALTLIAGVGVINKWAGWLKPTLAALLIFLILLFLQQWVTNLLGRLLNFGFLSVALLATAVAVSLIMPYLTYALSKLRSISTSCKTVVYR